MRNRLTEKKILQIVDDVFFHVYGRIRKDQLIEDRLREELMKEPHSGIVQLISLPFYSNSGIIKQKMELIKESFKNQRCHRMLKVSIYLEHIKKLYSIWQEEYGFIDGGVCESVCTFIDELESMADDICMLPESGEKVEFVDAKTFMENSGIRNELVDELYDVVEKYEYIDWVLDEFDDEFINSVKDFLSKFTTIFSISTEFKDLSAYLSDLYESLSEIKLDSIEYEKKDILKKLLRGVYDDLNEWARNVVFEQTALDVHYLDHSLAANVEQIRIMLGLENREENSKGDIELF